MRIKLTSILLLVLLWNCGRDDKQDASGDNPKLLPNGEIPEEPVREAASYRGFKEVDQLLARKLLKPDPNQFAQAMRHVPGELIQLLGRQTGNGLQSNFTNGDPNPLNMMLWLVAIKGLGQDLAGLCLDEPEHEGHAMDLEFVRSRLKDDVIETITRLCSWQEEEFDHAAAMGELWQLLVGFRAPATERAAWVLYFSSEDYIEQPAVFAIESMVIGALYSPYFLLDQ